MEKLIYIVGMGPGDERFMSMQARKAVEDSDIIVAYTLYAKLMKKIYPQKSYMTTGMKAEIDRCRLCIELAESNKKVALICSGDPGVYGMASLVYELVEKDSEIELVVVPGITAACSGAAVLGAPLNHDFCVISLSDLLTPYELIVKRLKAAIEGDFVIVLYNPSSKSRADYLMRACEVMLEAGADKGRACGYVENIGREGTKAFVGTLEELRTKSVNMFTTVFIGNSESYIKNGKLITKRGYK